MLSLREPCLGHIDVCTLWQFFLHEEVKGQEKTDWSLRCEGIGGGGFLGLWQTFPNYQPPDINLLNAADKEVDRDVTKSRMEIAL